MPRFSRYDYEAVAEVLRRFSTGTPPFTTNAASSVQQLSERVIQAALEAIVVEFVRMYTEDNARRFDVDRFIENSLGYKLSRKESGGSD
jgi:hypothetical protein